MVVLMVAPMVVVLAGKKVYEKVGKKVGKMDDYTAVDLDLKSAAKSAVVKGFLTVELKDCTRDGLLVVLTESMTVVQKAV